jgi:virginiamycin B lyase
LSGLTLQALPTANAAPYGIAAATDGSIWFAEYNASKVGRIDRHGRISEIPLPFQPLSIATTPPSCTRSAVWVGSFRHGLAQITPGT